MMKSKAHRSRILQRLLDRHSLSARQVYSSDRGLSLGVGMDVVQADESSFPAGLASLSDRENYVYV